MKIITFSIMVIIVGLFNSLALIARGGAGPLLSWSLGMGPMLVGSIILLTAVGYLQKKRDKELKNFYKI